MNTLLTKSAQVLRKSIHFFYTHLLQPKSKTEDSQRKEFILNIILLSSIVLVTWSNVFLITAQIQKGDSSHGASFILFTGFTMLFVGLYILSRTGKFIQSSYILIILYYLGASYAAYRWGPSLPASLLGFALVIVISSILINTRFSFVMGVCIFATISTLGYFEVNQKILPDNHWKKEVFIMGDAIEYSLLLFVIMIISWLSNREIEKSLFRARNSEQELKTERDHLEVKVEERTKELKKVQFEKMSQLYRFAEFGRLSSGVFHDLLNPLNSITLNVSELERVDTEHFAKIQPHIEKAIRASRKMEQFIQIVRKQITTQESCALFSINKEIMEVLSILDYKAKKLSVDVSFQADSEVEFQGNALKLHQIVTNLVSNAIDSFESIVDSRKKTVHITLRASAEHIKIFVKDTGCGIRKDILAHIFDPFFTTKSSAKGSGLGLSTTKHIIEKDFNGIISVSPNAPYGTLFIITIPKTTNDQQPVIKDSTSLGPN